MCKFMSQQHRWAVCTWEQTYTAELIQRCCVAFILQSPEGKKAAGIWAGGGAHLHIHESTYTKWGVGVVLHSSHFRAWQQYFQNKNVILIIKDEWMNGGTEGGLSPKAIYKYK